MSYRLMSGYVLMLFVGVLLSACAHGPDRRLKHPTEPPFTKFMGQPDLSPFARTISQGFPSCRPVACGMITCAGGKRAGWVLLTDEDSLIYILGLAVRVKNLERIGAETSWSPYLLRWRNKTTLADNEERVEVVTSFEMARKDSTSTGQVELAEIKTHLKQFEQVLNIQMSFDLFISQP